MGRTNITNMTIIDRRATKPISINDVEVVTLGITGRKKSEIRVKLENEKIPALEGKKLIIRYSSNYASEEMKRDKPGSYVADRTWQTWHSVDVPVDNIDNIVSEDVYNIFVVHETKEILKCLIFNPKRFKELIEKKKKCNSYTDYTNAQGKKYRKFNFYFTYDDSQSVRLDDRGVSTELEKIVVRPNTRVGILKRLFLKISTSVKSK